MDLLNIEGESIKNFTGIINGSTCSGKCQETENCSAWTYKDGVCYMKNERTFMIRNKLSNGIVSGKKNCKGLGNKWFWNDIDSVRVDQLLQRNA